MPRFVKSLKKKKSNADAKDRRGKNHSNRSEYRAEDNVHPKFVRREPGERRNGRRGSKGNSRGRSNDRFDKPKTKVECASCGVTCEVPFKPTNNKPVYCDDCFSKEKKPQINLDEINEKLDKIMQALNIK